MISRLFAFTAIVAIFVLIPEKLSATPATLGLLNFTPAAPQGFGDFENSWPWSMAWWNNQLYVGTNRAFGCVKQWEENVSLGANLFPYPPKASSGIVCSADPAALPLQAEIWTLNPESKTWTQVFQSPADLVNPDQPSYSLARDIGYRTMAAFTESDGTEALYVGGVSSQPMWQGHVPPPRFLRTTDGVNFTEVPQDPGTFLGSLSHPSLDVLTSFNGSLFAVNGEMEGEGIIIQSSSPSTGDNAWQQVSPDGLNVIELASFNGFLYVGTYDSSNGYSVLKTDATGPAPYTYTTVIPAGAYLPTGFGAYAWSMSVFNNQLYVGAGMLIAPNPNNDDILRINPDDTWDLVEGTPRNTPDGMKYPLSGLPNGFGNGFEDGIWHMQGSGGDLFIGASDESQTWESLPGFGATLAGVYGFDAFATPDGVYITQLTQNGFGNIMDFGIARMADTPYGAFLGGANVQSGLNIWKNSTFPSTFPAPGALQLELSGKSPVLSWDSDPQAVSYHVLRAPLTTFTSLAVFFKDPFITGTYVDIGTTSSTSFTDSPVLGSEQYLYFVVGADANGNLSDHSNLVYAPPLAPPADFDQLLSQVDSLTARGHFLSPASAATTKATIANANAAASMKQFESAAALLAPIAKTAGSIVQAPYNSLFKIYVEKLERRLTLAADGTIDFQSR